MVTTFIEPQIGISLGRELEVTKRYKAVKGAHITDEEAKVYGERIEQLQEEHGGTVTADIVLEDARSENSPLHDHFAWDDQYAAEEYRKQQAHQLLRSIQVVVIDDGEEKETRVFHCITVSKELGNGYASLSTILSEESLRKQVIEKAFRELDSWRRKYEIYDELNDIFLAIEQAKRAVLV